MNTKSHRPADHAERDSCIGAVDPLIGDASTDPVVASALTLKYVPVRDDYLTARTAASVATAAATAASTAADTAGTSFDTAFRLWSSSVRAPDGRAVPQAVAGLLRGVRPGDLVRLRYRDEVTRTADLLDQVAANPALAGDAARLADLEVARTALATAVTADEGATRARIAANAVSVAASLVFDRVWGVLVKLMVDAGAGAVLPVFHRSAAAPTEPDGDELPAANEPKAEAAADPPPDPEGEEAPADVPPPEPTQAS